MDCIRACPLRAKCAVAQLGSAKIIGNAKRENTDSHQRRPLAQPDDRRVRSLAGGADSPPRIPDVWTQTQRGQYRNNLVMSTRMLCGNQVSFRLGSRRCAVAIPADFLVLGLELACPCFRRESQPIKTANVMFLGPNRTPAKYCEESYMNGDRAAKGKKPRPTSGRYIIRHSHSKSHEA